MSDFKSLSEAFFMKDDAGVIQMRRTDCNYKYKYNEIFQSVADQFKSNFVKKQAEEHERQTYRSLILNDLFFLTYFGIGVEAMNNPFIVDRCRMIEDGPQSDTLDVWARGHGKSLIITTAETVQGILKNPETCTLIMSYKAQKAQDFLAAVRSILERPFLTWCFPDILYQDANREAPSWSLQGGITVKRKSIGRKECTVNASGLVDGQPTGGHWERLIWDDVETADIAENPEQLQVLINKFEVSQNLFTMTEKDRGRVIGTFYSHCGLLTHLRDKKDIHGKPAYTVRIIPATDNGLRDGKPVYLSQEQLDKKKGDRTFNSQQLCSPMPQDEILLDYSMIQHIKREDLPKSRIKFILIDPAGDDAIQTGVGDPWGFACVSVEPVYDDLGTSKIFIEDAICSRMKLSEATDAACSIYIRNGRIAMLGIERTASDSTYVHVMNALKAKGRHTTLKQSKRDHGNVVLLNPSGRNKNRRVESALAWPMSNSRVYIADTVSREARDVIKYECDTFPYTHVTLLDVISYVYDLIQQGWFIFDSEDEEEDDYGQPRVDFAQGRSQIGGY